MKLSVELQTGLGQSSNGHSWFLRIQDEASGLQILELALTEEQVGQLMCNRTVHNARADLMEDSVFIRLGMKHEWKEELVPCDLPPAYTYKDTDQETEIKRKALQPFEVDGWVGHKRDIGDFSRRVKSKSNPSVWKVHFDRWVDPEKQGTGDKVND